MTDLTIVNLEALLVSLLGARLADVSVATRVPNPRPDSFVRVQRIGGDERNIIQERPTLLVECWGRTDLEALLLARRCWSELQGPDEVQFNGVELQERRLTSPVNFPDPTTSLPRYQFTLQTTVTLEASS